MNLDDTLLGFVRQKFFCGLKKKYLWLAMRLVTLREQNCTQLAKIFYWNVIRDFVYGTFLYN